MRAATEGQCIISEFHSIPTFIAIHCIISAADNTDTTAAELLDVVFYFFYICDPGSWRNISSIHKTVDTHMIQSALCCKTQCSFDMVYVAVYAAVREKSENVKRTG